MAGACRASQCNFTPVIPREESSPLHERTQHCTENRLSTVGQVQPPFRISTTLTLGMTSLFYNYFFIAIAVSKDQQFINILSEMLRNCTALLLDGHRKGPTYSKSRAVVCEVPSYGCPNPSCGTPNPPETVYPVQPEPNSGRCRQLQGKPFPTTPSATGFSPSTQKEEDDS